MGSSRPRMGRSLLLSLLLSRERGDCNESNVHHIGENSNVKSKKSLPGALNVEVVYDTSPEITTRVAQGSLLIRGTKALDAQVG
jgi:hypothetical protein